MATTLWSTAARALGALALLPCLGSCGSQAPAESLADTGEACFAGAAEFVGRLAGSPWNGVLVVDSGEPCADSPDLVEPLANTGITGATEKPYKVEGGTLKEACKDIYDKKGPKEGDTRYAGHTSFAYKFKWSRTGNQVHKDDVTWTVTVELPEWTPPASASQADKDAWNRLLQELRKHEQGHVDRFNQGMQKVKAAEV